MSLEFFNLFMHVVKWPRFLKYVWPFYNNIHKRVKLLRLPYHENFYVTFIRIFWYIELIFCQAFFSNFKYISNYLETSYYYYPQSIAFSTFWCHEEKFQKYILIVNSFYKVSVWGIFVLLLRDIIMLLDKTWTCLM